MCCTFHWNSAAGPQQIRTKVYLQVNVDQNDDDDDNSGGMLAVPGHTGLPGTGPR